MVSRMIQLIAALCVLLAASSSRGADGDPVLLTSGVSGQQTHAWAVYRNANDELLLVHVPPRDSDASASVPIDPAAAGEMHAMRPLGAKAPAAIGAIGPRVYLLYPKAFVSKQQLMRVYSGRAVPGAVGAMWGFLPLDRLDAEFPIRSGGVLIDLVATSAALWALLDEGDDGPRLLTLTESGWEARELPDERSADELRLSAMGDEPVLLDSASRAGELTPLTFDADQRRWVTGALAPIEAPGGAFKILPGEHGMIVVDWDDDPDRARIRTWSRAGDFVIAGEVQMPASGAYAVLGSTNRLFGIAARHADEPTQPSVSVIEMDLADGSVMHRGDPIAQSPVSANEFRLLVGMMFMIMLGVLVVVIMPDRPDAMGIPEGFALADPGRRLVATMLDVGVIAILMGKLFGVHPQEIITLSVIVRADNAWLVIPSTMASGVALMSFSERVLGASPGKLVVGLRVVRAQQGPMRRAPVWALLVRNVIKWVLPPVAALAMVDPETLHRGDRATRTIVVSALRQPQADEPGPDERG